MTIDQADTSVDLLTTEAADRLAQRATAKGVEFSRTGNVVAFPAKEGVKVIPGAGGIIGVVKDGVAIASVIEGEEIDQIAA